MKKSVKGGIALGAGLLLLLGGGGTFALWNVTANVSAGTVETGHLTIDTAATTDQWYDAAAFNADHATWASDSRSNPADPGHAAWLTEEPVITDSTYDGDKIVDIANWPVAPGAELAFVSSDIDVTAEGANLKFEVTAEAQDGLGSPLDLSGSGLTVDVGDVAFSGISPSAGLVESSGTWSIDPAVATGSVSASGTVKVDVVFSSSWVAQEHADEDLSLANIAITLQQVA